jgi:hypothetical protein
MVLCAALGMFQNSAHFMLFCRMLPKRRLCGKFPTIFFDKETKTDYSILNPRQDAQIYGGKE